MEDAIARYRAASESNDIDALVDTLAPDVELVSPISGRMVFRGREDLRVLLGAIYGTISQLHWREEIGNGSARVVIGDTRIGPFGMSDAMAFDLDREGRIRRIRPHLRPWLALTALAVVLLPKVGRHPGLVLRALRG